MPTTIRKGSTGSDVRTCQERLNVHGYACVVDGAFGNNTDALVRSFQGASDLVVDGIVGTGTWAALMAKPSSDAPLSGNGLPPVVRRAQDLGYEVWDTPYRMFLFGIRAENRGSNSFDDTLGCAWTDEDGLWRCEYWPGTTDPGTYYLEHPSNSAGCAILVADQYIDTWMLGMHRGKYEALCQLGNKVSVYRDASGDVKLDLDPGTIVSGYFGINLHAATQVDGGESTQVNKWSAGCQVHATQRGFARMMELAHLQIEKTGLEKFSYTLLDLW